jgi:hypothetical protein
MHELSATKPVHDLPRQGGCETIEEAEEGAVDTRAAVFGGGHFALLFQRVRRLAFPPFLNTRE